MGAKEGITPNIERSGSQSDELSTIKRRSVKPVESADETQKVEKTQTADIAQTVAQPTGNKTGRLPMVWRVLLPVLVGAVAIGGVVAGVAIRRPGGLRGGVRIEESSQKYVSASLEVELPELMYGDELVNVRDGVTAKVDGTTVIAEAMAFQGENISKEAELSWVTNQDRKVTDADYFRADQVYEFDLKIPLNAEQSLNEKSIVLSDNLTFVKLIADSEDGGRYDTVRLRVQNLKKHELNIEFGDLYYGDSYEDLTISATLDGEEVEPKVTYYVTMMKAEKDTIIQPMCGHELDLTFEDLKPGVGFTYEEATTAIHVTASENVADVFPFLGDTESVGNVLRVALNCKQHELFIKLDPVRYGALLSTAHYTVTLDGKTIDSTYSWFDYGDGTMWNEESVFGADVNHSMDIALELPNEGYFLSLEEGDSGCAVKVSDNLEYVCALSYGDYPDEPTNRVRVHIIDFLGEPYYYNGEEAESGGSESNGGSSANHGNSGSSGTNSNNTGESSTQEESSSAPTSNVIEYVGLDAPWPAGGNITPEISLTSFSAPCCVDYRTGGSDDLRTNSGVLSMGNYSYYTNADGTGSVLSDANWEVKCRPFSVKMTVTCRDPYSFSSSVVVSSGGAIYTNGYTGKIVSYTRTDARTLQITMQVCIPHCGEWQTVSEPTCSTHGFMEMLCAYCDEQVETRDIPSDPNAHEYEYECLDTVDGCLGTCIHCQKTITVNHCDIESQWLYEPLDDIGYHEALCPYCHGYLGLDYDNMCSDSDRNGYCDKCGGRMPSPT